MSPRKKATCVTLDSVKNYIDGIYVVVVYDGKDKEGPQIKTTTCLRSSAENVEKSILIWIVSTKEMSSKNRTL